MGIEFLLDILNQLLLLRTHTLHRPKICLRHHQHHWLSYKNLLNPIKQLNLSLDRILSSTTRYINKVKYTSLQMGKSRNRLHFNGVPFLERSIQQTWTVDYLPTNFFVVCVTDVQGLGCERIGLDFEVGVGDVVGEA